MVLNMGNYMRERRAHRVRRGVPIPFEKLYHQLGHVRPQKLVGQIEHLAKYFKFSSSSHRKPAGKFVRRKTRKVLYPHPSGHYKHAFFKAMTPKARAKRDEARR